MKKIIIIFLLIFTTFLSNIIYADENTAFLEDIDNLNRIMQEYQDLMQINIIKQLVALTGDSDYATYLNSPSDLDNRKWSADDWQSALEGLSGGNEQRYQELLKNYQEEHPTLTSAEASNGMSSPYATNYRQQVKTNQAASTQATYAFNETNSHLDNIYKLTNEIQKTEDTKRIQDLNARVTAEVANLQVEIIKGLAVVNEQLAQQQANEIQDKTAAAKFNTIPE